MPTGFKGFNSIDELEAAIANAPEVEVICDERDITALLKVCWHEFVWNSDQGGFYGNRVDAAQKLMRLVCEALEVDYDEVVKHARTNAD